MKSSQTFDIFAVTLPGFESVCARELKGLGLKDVKAIEGGVEFRGGLKELYQANLWLRSASRILVRIGTIKCRDFPALYKKTLQLPWGRFIRPGTGIRVNVASHASRLQHSDRIGDTIKSAIHHCLGVSRPNWEGSPQLVLARLDQDHCQLSVDSSGDLLHRRGYRTSTVSAPLRETLAAGLLLMLNWQGETPFLDPMCGSGTFPIEAALLAAERAPGALRRFAFMDWPHFRPNLWKTLRTGAAREARPPAGPIFGSDTDPRAVDATCRNAEAAGIREHLIIQKAALSELETHPEPGLILCNPPYGKRLSGKDDLIPFYREMGVLLRRKFAGWTLALTCPSRLAKATELPLERISGFRNGGLKIYLFRVLL